MIILEENTLVHGRYRILRRIGKGGMGTVYEATDERLSQSVALKQTALEGEHIARHFEREAKILAGLRHPALARVMDYFTDDIGQFLVMDFIDGEDLAHMLKEHQGPFPITEVMNWADQLLLALEYLHTRTPPVIHRDIKPHNIKLTPEGQIVLLDFGLAKDVQTVAQNTASILGYTPQYAPLEQIQGTGTESRSDLYALAATLYYLITGTLPANAMERALAITKRMPDPLRPPYECNPNIPEETSEVLQQALSLHPDGRPSSAAAMRNALQASIPTLLQNEENIRPPSPYSREVVHSLKVGAPEQEEYSPQARTEAHKPPKKPQQSQQSQQSQQTGRKILPLAIGGGVAAILLVIALVWGFMGSGNQINQNNTSNSSEPSAVAAEGQAVADQSTPTPTHTPTPSATSEPTSTPTPSPTPTVFITPAPEMSDEALQTAREEYAQRSSQYRKILDETFDSEATKRRWSQTENERFSKWLVYSYYQIRLKQADAFTWDTWREQQPGNNYLVQADVAINPNSSGGIIFDEQADGFTKNAFLITSDNRWKIITIEDGTIIAEKSGGAPTNTIIGDSPNQLRVFRMPGEIQFWINHTLVGTITPFYEGGYAGVIGQAGSDTNRLPTTVIIDNFYVWVP
jgi:serine/threonine protein kinase